MMYLSSYFRTGAISRILFL